MTALILEGGGMRTAFTAGVLDYFISKKLIFNNIIGVSTGAYNALSYRSKQRAHTIDMYVNSCGDKRYRRHRGILRDQGINMATMLKENAGCLPFDYEQCMKNKASITAVATNCITGSAAYFPVTDPGSDISYVIAAASFPLFSPTVYIDGIPYLDGCITDPLPAGYALKQGYKKYIFVLTGDRTYYKDKDPRLNLIRRKYPQYPRLIEAFECQHVRYNQELEMVYCLERMGQALILQPGKPVKVSVMEKNPGRLLELYNEGFRIASQNYDILKGLEDGRRKLNEKV